MHTIELPPLTPEQQDQLLDWFKKETVRSGPFFESSEGRNISVNDVIDTIKSGREEGRLYLKGILQEYTIRRREDEARKKQEGEAARVA
ncbi:MAG: hypothetical protein WCV62_04930 [Candidatus Peribacteraceae bacterium]|jgi:hypothetical protein